MKRFERKERLFKKEPRDFCEGCSDLGLYDEELKGCVVCKSGKSGGEISDGRFRERGLHFDKYLGYYDICVDAVSERYCARSSAGGFATSLLHDLLEKGLVDYVVSVAFSSEQQAFIYRRFDRIVDLVSQQRSAYFPVKLTGALEIIRNNPGKCVITGIPSAIKAIELLKESDPLLQDRVKYTIGLVSGGIKIWDYTDYLCRKAGKVNGFCDISALSYRDKPSQGPYDGSNYLFRALTKETEYTLKSDRIKMNWPSGLLKSFASDFCDDTFNICADVTVMDGWLQRYKDSNGVSLAIIRNRDIRQVVETSEDLKWNRISPSDIIASQRGGLSHKTIGLNARLKIFRCFNEFVPVKDIRAESPVHPIIFLEQLLRIVASHTSRKVYFATQSFEKVDQALAKYIFCLRVVNKCKRLILRG